MNPVERMYDEKTQHEWERLERHRTEFAVTLRALKEFLPSPPAKILDIGGGPGRYAITLCQQGHHVTLFDLSQNNLKMARTKAKEAGVTLTDTIHGNVLDLPFLINKPYNVALMLGPLYHLLELAERETAVAHARSILQPGGILFAAFITRYAPFRTMVERGNLEWIINNVDRAERILKTGQNPQTPGNSFPDSYFIHPDEVLPLMEGAGFKTVAMLAVEGVVSGHEQHINQATGEIWEKWVDLNYRVGHDPALFGAADHLLYIGQK